MPNNADSTTTPQSSSTHLIDLQKVKETSLQEITQEFETQNLEDVDLIDAEASKKKVLLKERTEKLIKLVNGQLEKVIGEVKQNAAILQAPATERTQQFQENAENFQPTEDSTNETLPTPKANMFTILRLQCPLTNICDWKSDSLKNPIENLVKHIDSKLHKGKIYRKYYCSVSGCPTSKNTAPPLKKHEIAHLATIKAAGLLLQCQYENCLDEGTEDHRKEHYKKCNYQTGVFLCINFPKCHLALPTRGDAVHHYAQCPYKTTGNTSVTVTASADTSGPSN